MTSKLLTYKTIALLNVIPSDLTWTDTISVSYIHKPQQSLSREDVGLLNNTEFLLAIDLVNMYYQGDTKKQRALNRFIYVSSVQFLGLLKNNIVTPSKKKVQKWLLLNALQYIPLDAVSKSHFRNVPGLLPRLSQINNIRFSLERIASKIPMNIQHSDLKTPGARRLAMLHKKLGDPLLQLFFLSKIVTFQLGLQNDYLLTQTGYELSTLFAPLAEELSLIHLSRSIFSHRYEATHPQLANKVFTQIKENWGVSYYDLFDVMHNVHQTIKRELIDADIDAIVLSRVKTVLSTMKKMERHTLQLHDMHDLLALTIVTLDDTKSLWIEKQLIPQLGIFQSTRIFDKKNHSRGNSNYRAIHYKLLLHNSRLPLEIKSQLYQAFVDAEIGSASHKTYKNRQDKKLAIRREKHQGKSKST